MTASLPPRRHARVAALLAIVGTVAASHAGAQTAQTAQRAQKAPAAAATPPTIDACYVPASGTIYRIDTPSAPAPGAPKACLSSTHVKFTWNQQGPKGDPGSGLSGFTEVVTEVSPPADAQGRRSVRATCPAGKMAVGGNYSIFAAGGNYAWGIEAVSSGLTTFAGPTAPNDTFFVLTADAPGYASTPFFRVVVKCATAP